MNIANLLGADNLLEDEGALTVENSSGPYVGWQISAETLTRADEVDAEIFGARERLAALIG